MTFPTAKARGFLLRPLLHRLIPCDIAMSYTVSTSNMLADIGNGTMNIMYINNSRPVEKKCFTEKYGTHQCMLAVRESLLKELDSRLIFA